ncbi:MAG: division/cell wall cluster transcriptional repressor MraZ [Pseudomonadota bacterium]|jgi:MraZ protein|nr:division/cell wall cluster transcriptional repressor MraZ [Pseudomonadota bacterium]URQ71188.1 division/cell wall cluster transcriptional repressor MraZ [SAR86 cluster bacterium]URQ72556.1 division/cell wall cluster transcriptional repressor MraZ [SAR86 cluster bacterium]|tara:strand:- start:2086 stop:2553 length:468 start_codon:yes stop_codon:yes gene_type:complete
MYGYNLVAIDTKGRISLPSKYRESLKDFEASKIIITRDPQYPSLKLYPKKTWDYISSNLISLQTLDPIVRKLQWTILGNASVINFDLNNRMNALISSDLREYAELNNEKKVVLIGMGDKFEIWNSENWDARQTSSALSSEILEIVLPDSVKNLSF